MIKGTTFEIHTKTWLEKLDFTIIHVTPKYDVNHKWFNLELLKPDLKIVRPNSNEEIWIECKFRTYRHKKRRYTIITEEQLKRHSTLNDAPVYVLLGIGRKPNKPTYLYKIPISECLPVMDIRDLRKKYQIIKDEAA